ncbi:DUF1559 family PulG-like putative transporter [Anatilimnocola floriformis]|uniref:DUF1559 family PulG-like putative transporter n=1 Tax=Anatilimnocola floriformis TaxID=2948575 RepID=UPI0020C3B258|nr:DUF1559 domain-containing protein [Anatilimnocola floriformis]
MTIEFRCPHCGKQTVVADQFAGQSGACAGCGQQITIPKASFAAPATMQTPMYAPTGGSKSGGGSTLLVILAIVMGCILLCCGGVASVLFIGRSQMGGRRDQMISQNNMKQLGLALHNYHDVHGSFPPAVVTDADGKPLYSGRVLLLPYMDQAALFQQFDKSKAWDAPENLAVTDTIIKTFQDPNNKSGSLQRSDYVFVTGVGTMFEGSKAVKFSSVTDGLSNTIIMVGTSRGPSNWAEPVEWNVDLGMPPPTAEPNEVQILFADGSVRFMALQDFQQNMRAITTKGGGEIVNLP